MSRAQEHRPLHLVDVAPPWQSGYTVRTQQLVSAQVQLGMGAAVAALPSWYVEPSYRHLADDVAVLQQDDVTYYRRTAPRWLDRSLIHLSQRLIERQVRGARRFRRVLQLPDDPWTGFVEGLGQRVEPTVVHAHTPWRVFSGARRLADACGLPTVYEVRGFWDLQPPDEPRRLEVQGIPIDEWRASEVAAARAADAVVTLGEAMRTELVRRGIDERKIHLVPNGVDASCFAPVQQKDPQLLRQLDLADRFVLGYVTTVDRREGIETVLRALKELRTRAQVVFVLVGDGPDLPRLSQLVERWGLQPQVRFVGRIPHSIVPRYYSLLDAFVVPRMDTEVCRLVTPLKPLEALAQGIPTLVSDLPALRELIAPGERGGVFRAGSSRALARAVDNLLANPVHTRSLARRGRAWVTERRSWGHLALRTLDAYEYAAAAWRARQT